MFTVRNSLQFRRATRVLGIAIFASLGASAWGAPAQADALPESSRVMTPTEIHELYNNKSWQWKSGAAYLADERRRFSAWVDDEAGKFWSEGRWVISDSGQMCLNATWHSTAGSFPATTCFSHRVDNGTIYQKREPDGSWYVFRHAKPRDDDEGKKLVRKDLVSAQISTVKLALDQHSER